LTKRCIPYSKVVDVEIPTGRVIKRRAMDIFLPRRMLGIC
jgi:hypothetical protein